MKESIKAQYVGLDVSLKSVSICISDNDGNVQWRGEIVKTIGVWSCNTTFSEAVILSYGDIYGPSRVARGS